MSGYFSESKIREKLANLEAAYDVVLAGGKSYRLNDGQGDIQVTQSSLETLQKAIDYWEARLSDLTSGSGIISMRVGR